MYVPVAAAALLPSARCICRQLATRLEQQINSLAPMASTQVAIALVGDSDIARWPADMLPSPSLDLSASSCPNFHVIAKGKSGAILDEIIPLTQETVEIIANSSDNVDHVILVLCAGENDLGRGYSSHNVSSSFERMIDDCFDRQDERHKLRWRMDIVFLGPKLEPWLSDDHVSRKQYVKLSKMLRRAAERHECSSQIKYIDCLKMFCGKSATIPGAITANAVAEERYFHQDRLHLSRDGYMVWKSVVETEIKRILASIAPHGDSASTE